MIHPAPSDQQLPPTTPSCSYEIVASEVLPAFDPVVTAKQCFLTARQIRIFNLCIIKTIYALFPMYVTGFLLRFVVVFGPAPAGRILGLISFVLQIPIVFQVIFAFRYEYVKVLLATFEFWFLSTNVAVWTVALTWYLQDTRALMLPSCLVDYVNMLLIEVYFQNTANVAKTATAFACFLFSLIIGVSLNAIDETFSEELFTVHNHALSRKDILVNIMATMITLVIRLSYRKLETMKSAKHGSAWERSIGYRCRIKLHVHQEQEQLTTVVSYSAISSESARRITVERMDAKRLLQLRFIGVPILFDSANTLCPSLDSGDCGILVLDRLPPAATPPSPVVHIVRLPVPIFPARDGAPMSVQHPRLEMDALLRGSRVISVDPGRLDRRRTHAHDERASQVENLAHSAAGAAQYDREGRDLLHDLAAGLLGVPEPPAVQYREVTIFVWCIRILHRIWTRTSEHEFLVMLGNVEYDYVSWKQSQRQRATPTTIRLKPTDLQDPQITVSSSSSSQPKQQDTVLQSAAPSPTTAAQAFS